MTTCVYRWSLWINKDSPNTGDGNDYEMMLAMDKAKFCPGGRITEVECSTVNNTPSELTGETVDCNVYSGLTCLFVENAPIPCSDYKVRYFCDCKYYITHRF